MGIRLWGCSAKASVHSMGIESAKAPARDAWTVSQEFMLTERAEP